MEAHMFRRVRELLDALEQTTGEPGDLTNTLQHITHTAQRFFRADDCAIFAMNPITNRNVASHITTGDLFKRNKEMFEQSGPGWLVRQVLEQSVVAR